MKKSILFYLLFFSLFALKAQSVTTFFNSSSFQIDDGLAIDKHGNLYGSHYMGTRVYKISPSGVASIFASGFNTPNGLAFNSQGDLYVADNIGNRIYRLDSLGSRMDTIVVGNPSGIIKSIDSDTMIFTQYSGHRIRKLAPDGTVSAPMAAGYPLSGPVGLCYGSDSTLYVGNFSDRKIFKLVNGQLTYIARVPGFSSTSLGFITYAKGYLYGTAFQSHQIYRIDPNFIDSTILFSGSTAGNLDGPLASATFNGPNGIIASRGGDSLLISDFNTGNIRLISGLITDLEEPLEEVNFQFYPNPLSDFLTIESNSNARVVVRIYDQIGRVQAESRLEAQSKKKLDLSKLDPALYFIEFKVGNRLQIRKLIKQ